jgi:cytochrome c oxidase subunit 2
VFKKFNNLSKSAFAALLMLSLYPSKVFSDWDALNMREGVTQVSRDVFELHMLIFYICVAIGAVVFSVMFYSLFRYTKKRNPNPSTFHESTKLEVAWTIVPFLILIAMAVPASKTLTEIYDDEEGEINIQVVGYQWKWEYKYLEDDINFFSNLSTDQDEIYNLVPKGENYLLEVDEPLIIPVDTRVRFLITANDVIHSWWVPDFAIKQDAIPGFINTAWTRAEETGIYRGNCTELCGKNHGFMPVVVKVVEKDEYNDWVLAKKEEAIKLAELTEKEWSLAELTERGEGVYQKNCVACHQMNGEGLPPIFPALAGSDIVMFDKDRNVEILMEGVQGAAMQSFANQLSEVDMAAVITYTRQAWGNAENGDGEYVVPSDIVEYKKPKI